MRSAVRICGIGVLSRLSTKLGPCRGIRSFSGPCYVRGLSSQRRGSVDRRNLELTITCLRRYASNKSNPKSWETTIYALSSAPGRAAIAVIRISGPACQDIYRALCPGTTIPRPRVASVRTLYEPAIEPSRNTVLDSSALVLYFPGPRTVTGEDVLEFHVHGGPAIVKAVLSGIANCGDGKAHDIRYAEPGEFTRRAFLNDRLDLTQVEALGDSLFAETEQQRRLSLRGTTGSLARQYEVWRQQLLHARGELEALIDFSEDQHFDESPAELCASVTEQVTALKRMLLIHCENAVRGEMLRHGISLSLLGAPNAGKSSLLNLVVGREAAIVSREAGTTRDVVEVGLDVGGYFCRFGDTAGLRNAMQNARHSGASGKTINPVEWEGMRRAKERAAESDVVVLVLSLETNDGHTTLHLDTEVATTAARLISEKNNVIAVINKCDLAQSTLMHEAAVQATLDAISGLRREDVHSISCKEAERPEYASIPRKFDPGGIQTFLHGLIGHFARLTAARIDVGGEQRSIVESDPSIWQESLGASQRHHALLESCVSHLDAFLAEVDCPSELAGVASAPQQLHSDPDEIDIVVAAEHLRSAADCLARITGKGVAGDVEEVLGVVFEKFCVGK